MPESDDYARAYFDAQFDSNREYWRRFGGKPELAGKRVLEVGCGHGAMAIDLASHGAEVLAVDLDESRIDFAQRNLSSRFPELVGRVAFAAVDATRLPENKPFDLIVSKDTFEHVDDVSRLLAGLGRLLRSDGIMYIGFSPLYYSPFGDHGRTGLRLPWAHAVLPHRLVITAASRRNSGKVTSLMDIGLNANTPAQFQEAFDASGLKIIEIKYNQGDKPMLRLFEKVRVRHRIVEKYATVSIYAEQ